MRKKFIKQGITKQYIDNYAQDIYKMLKEIIPEPDLLVVNTSQEGIENKVNQIGIRLNIIYKNKKIFSYFFPYNKYYILDIDQDKLISRLFIFLVDQLKKNCASILEQEFILDHYILLLTGKDDSHYEQELKQYRKYFTGKQLDHLNSIILLYKL